jgi:hypothetical protein
MKRVERVDISDSQNETDQELSCLYRCRKEGKRTADSQSDTMRTALVEDPETNVLDNAKQEVYIDLTDCDERPTKISNSAYMEPKVRVHTYHAMEFDHNKTGTLSLATKVSDERQTTFGMLSNPKIIDRCEEMSRENQQGAKSVLSQEIKDGGNAETDHSNPCSEVLKELSINARP